MPKYEDRQCPECGCYEFERYKKTSVIMEFRDGEFQQQRELLQELGFIFCVGCRIAIDNPKSTSKNKVIKQGKIVLQGE